MPITMLATTTADATLLSATHPSVARSASTPGILAASTTASWMSHGR